MYPDKSHNATFRTVFYLLSLGNTAVAHGRVTELVTPINDYFELKGLENKRYRKGIHLHLFFLEMRDHLCKCPP